jgi:hypothetical protein
MRAVSECFLQQLTQSHSGLVHLRLAISHRAAENSRNLVVAVTLHIVQNEHLPVPRRQVIHSALEVHAIDRTVQQQVGTAEFRAPLSRFFAGLGILIERIHGQRLFSQLHQHDIDRQAVKPGVERRIAAKV